MRTRRRKPRVCDLHRIRAGNHSPRAITGEFSTPPLRSRATHAAASRQLLRSLLSSWPRSSSFTLRGRTNNYDALAAPRRDLLSTQCSRAFLPELDEWHSRRYGQSYANLISERQPKDQSTLPDSLQAAFSLSPLRPSRTRPRRRAPHHDRVASHHARSNRIPALHHGESDPRGLRLRLCSLLPRTRLGTAARPSRFSLRTHPSRNIEDAQLHLVMDWLGRLGLSAPIPRRRNTPLLRAFIRHAQIIENAQINPISALSITARRAILAHLCVNFRETSFAHHPRDFHQAIIEAGTLRSWMSRASAY